MICGWVMDNKIVVAAQIAAPIGESAAAKIGFAQAVALDHGAHGAIHDDQALCQQGEERRGSRRQWIFPHQATFALSASRGRNPSAWQMAYVSSARFNV